MSTHYTLSEKNTTAGLEEASFKVVPDSVGRLTGNHLKFDPGQTDEGIFFVATDTGNDTKATAVQENTPSKSVFLVPLLAAVAYWLEVWNRLCGSIDLQIARLDTPLTVIVNKSDSVWEVG